MIIVGDGRQSNSFSMRESYQKLKINHRSSQFPKLLKRSKHIFTNMHLPVLPFENMAIYLKTNTFWLDNMQRFQVCSRLVSTFLRLRHQIWEKIPSATRWRYTLSFRGSQSLSIIRNCRRLRGVRTKFNGAIRGTFVVRWEV